MKNKVEFDVEVDGKTLKLCVERPTPRQEMDGETVRSAAFAELVRNKGMLRIQLEEYLRELKIWDDAKQEKYVSLLKAIGDDRKIVGENGRSKVRGTTLAQGRAAAVRIRKNSQELQELASERISIESSNTVESQAEQRKFNHLVSVCTKFADTGKPYYQSMEDFLNREDDPVGAVAPRHFANIYHKYDPDEEKKLPENEFLLRYGFVDEKLRYVKLVNGVKRLCDEEGLKLIDEDGWYVDEEGKRVDREGKLVETETYDFVDEDEGEGEASPHIDEKPQSTSEPPTV